MRPPGGGDIAPFGVGRQVKHVGVAARGQAYRVRHVGFELPIQQITGHDAARHPVNHHQFEHLMAWKEFDFADVTCRIKELYAPRSNC